MDDISQEIQRLQFEIQQREGLIATLQEEVRELERELEDFSIRYTRVLGVMTRLDAVKKAIADIENRHSIRRRYGDIPAEPPLWEAPPSSPVEEQFRRAQQERASEATSSKRSKRRTPAELDFIAQLKRLYRLLARRYHPDLADDPDDAERRTQLMAMINEAYRLKDLDALMALDHTSDAQEAGRSLAVLRLRQLQQTNRDLTLRMETLRQEHYDLSHNSLMDLKIEVKLAASEGRDLLGEIVARTEQEYWECMTRLDMLREANEM